MMFLKGNQLLWAHPAVKCLRFRINSIIYFSMSLKKAPLSKRKCLFFLPMKCVCHFHLVARVCKTVFGQIKADE